MLEIDLDQTFESFLIHYFNALEHVFVQKQNSLDQKYYFFLKSVYLSIDMKTTTNGHFRPLQQIPPITFSDIRSILTARLTLYLYFFDLDFVNLVSKIFSNGTIITLK